MSVIQETGWVVVGSDRNGDETIASVLHLSAVEALASKECKDRFLGRWGYTHRVAPATLTVQEDP